MSSIATLRSRLRSRPVEVVAVLAIVGISILTAYGQMDLLLWDETLYLSRGLETSRLEAAGWEDSVSYSGMYWLLSRFISDPVNVYFVGRTLSSVLVVLGVYISARMNTGAVPALSAAGVTAVLPVTYVWPSVAGPAAFSLLISAGLLWKWGKPWVLSIAAILIWLAAASRPEFTWMAMGVSGWVLVWQLRDVLGSHIHVRPWQVVTSLMGGLAVPLWVFAQYGNILQSSPRQWTAFTQHFALRNGAVNQDVWVSADEIARNSFPTSGSIMQAITENPSAVAEHVTANMLWLPTTLVGHLVGLGGEPLSRPLAIFTTVAFAVGLALALLRNRLKLRSLLITEMQTRTPGIVLIALMFVAFAIPALAIYPRPHYLILPSMLLLFIGAVTLDRVPDKRGQLLAPGLTTVVGLALLAILASQGWLERIAEPPAWETSIRALQALPEGVRIVSVDERVCTYINDCVALSYPVESERGLSFPEYLERNDVNAVLNVPILLDSPWGQLPGANEFRSDPRSYGFREVAPEGPIVVRDPK